MSFQLYSFNLVSAFIGTSDSSQQSQRNTYTANVTLTLKPERQLDHGFMSKSQGSSDSNYVLLIHTGPQQLVRLYLAEFVQTGGQPMPYDLEHRESRNAIRLRYEPSFGERCQVGVEFSKSSDFVQAAQLLERLGLCFRAPEQARATSRALDFRSSQTSPQPLGISPPASSLSNRRAGSALSVSQRSWSPMSWPLTSSPSSLPNQLPVRRPFSTLTLPHPRSESPASGSGSAPLVQPHFSQSNLFIAQDVSRSSLPPFHLSQTRPIPQTGESRSLFLDHNAQRSVAFRSEAEEAFTSEQVAPTAPSPLRSSSTFSRLPRLQPLLSEDLESIMPPPRQLPFQNKKQKVSLSTRNDNKEDHRVETVVESSSDNLAGAARSARRTADDGAITRARRSSPALQITAENPPNMPFGQPLKTVNKCGNLESPSAKPRRLASSPAPASIDKGGPKTRQRGIAEQPGRWSKRLRKISPEKVLTDGEISVDHSQPQSASKGAKMQKASDKMRTRADAEYTLGLNDDTVMGKANAEINIENANNVKETISKPAHRSRRKRGIPDAAPVCATSNDAETQTESRMTSDCASYCDIRPEAQAAGTQTHREVTDAAISCDLRPANQDKCSQTDSTTQIVGVSPQMRQQNVQSVGTQVEEVHQGHEPITPVVASDAGVQTHMPIVCASTQTDEVKERWESRNSFDGMVFSTALRLIEEAKDLMHHHIDSDLDRLEAGLEVEPDRSMDEMLQAVENLAQKALDEHGDEILGIPFEMLARDYLKTSRADTDL